MNGIEQHQIIKYQRIFKDKEGIDISENDIMKIIQNIDSIGDLLFDKYLQNGKT